ncbi:MAG: CoB--CoM heterodisulfide reductase iron-sulfur subunit A family protein [Chloroflexota bacterium]|nr:CoB--CoM heterodisulfide reductase iron-sulfur subunit A family protein [Chloroflexota bacterium]
MPEKDKIEKNIEAQPSTPSEEVRIGVYTCYCGGNISDVVECESVAKALSDRPNVVASRTHMSMCSDAGQAMIEDDIKNNNVNRVIIGACAPSLHEKTFRATVERAGLNPYLYHHVGLREQDSWIHGDDPEGATEKAVRLMTTGLAKARLLKQLDSIKLVAEKHALVIGGGVAGLRSALDIARSGIQVTLVEKSPFLGGRMAQLETLFPTEEQARDTLHTLIEQVAAHPKIKVHTLAQLVDVSGYVGDFRIKIRQDSRGVTDETADAAIAACDQEVADDYNYGLTKRKVVYRAYPGCYPSTPAVDWANCPDGKLKVKVDGQNLTLKNEPETFELKVGAFVMATGFNPYVPREGEFGYGEVPEVITLAQLIRLLTLVEDGQELEWNGRSIRDVALIHCVGSRQIDGVNEPQEDGQVNPYCSRVCCTASLHMLNILHERFPNINLFDIYQDIRTYGRGHEPYYSEALENMVRFVRVTGTSLPEVSSAPQDDTHPVLVKAIDYLTQGVELEIPVDLVVLAGGVMPRQIDDLIKMLKISPGTDRFLLEVHPKLRPVETAVPGVVLAGTAQGPMNIQESCASAAAAASKVVILLGQGLVELEPFVAWVNPELCTGSGECVEVCSYEDAIALETFTDNGKQVTKAIVTPANCVGCGACVSACPNQAVDVQGWTLKQYESMVEAIVADLPEIEVVA